MTPNDELREALLAPQDWILFTSENGVEACMAELGGARLDARALAGRQLAAVGAATAEALAAAGLRADFVPSEATSARLATELPEVQEARILLPVSALADESLASALRARGGLPQQVAAYDTVAEELDERQRLELMEADAITFTSASTARNLAASLGEARPPEWAKLISIGPRTSAAVREAFGRVDREAAAPGLDELVRAVVEALS
jgi:uroporphyrinogen III methyltransferase/synthase